MESINLKKLSWINNKTYIRKLIVNKIYFQLIKFNEKNINLTQFQKKRFDYLLRTLRC